MITRAPSQSTAPESLEDVLLDATGLPSLNAVARACGLTASTLWRHVKSSRLTQSDLDRLIPLLDQLGADNGSAQKLRKARPSREDAPNRLAEFSNEELIAELRRRANEANRSLKQISEFLGSSSSQ